MDRLECDAVLFDLDGVLVDSTNCIIRHWTAWAERHGIDLDTIIAAAHGIRSVETIRLVAPHLDAEGEAERMTANEILDTDGVVPIEGAEQLLQSLPTGAWAIVTSGNRKLATVRLKRVGLPVPRIMVTGDDVAHGKPAPEPYLLGGKRLGFAPDRCVVIEDAPAGVQSGRMAGMRVIAISVTYPKEELIKSGADIVIERLTDLDIRESMDGSCLVIHDKFSTLKRPRYAMPDTIGEALTESGLMDAYRERPAYQQNDYVGWITRAKRPETVQKRLAQMLEELERGNKYMKMDYRPKMCG